MPNPFGFARHRKRTIALALPVVGALLFFWPHADKRADTTFTLIAHRGVHQPLDRDVAEHRKSIPRHGCTAGMIDPVNHTFIENTISSIRAAFATGATMVEIDIHLSKEGTPVVFHDFMLECRTDAKLKGCKATNDDEGKCLIWNHDLQFLKSLDLGYNYSSDGGETFPLRGKAIGLLPTLDEVVAAFPGKAFALDIKGDDRPTIPFVAEVLNKHPLSTRRAIHWMGVQTNRQREALLAVEGSRVVLPSAQEIKRCMKWFVTTGWFGYAPPSCQGTAVGLPYQWMKKMGWFGKHLALKVHAQGGRFYVLFVDTANETKEVLDWPIDGVFTNRVEVVGPLTASNQNVTQGVSR
jgi:glycerophosphoryl diester phosphodiesterase